MKSLREFQDRYLPEYAATNPCTICGKGESEHQGMGKFCPIYATFRAARPSPEPSPAPEPDCEVCKDWKPEAKIFCSACSPAPEPKPEWTQRPAFVKLVDDAQRAADAGFDQLCLECCEGFNGRKGCPRCAVKPSSPPLSPEPESADAFIARCPSMDEGEKAVVRFVFSTVVTDLRHEITRIGYTKGQLESTLRELEAAHARMASLTTCDCGRPKYSRCDVCEARAG